MKKHSSNHTRLLLAEISKTGFEHSSFNAAVIEQIESLSVFMFWFCRGDHLKSYGDSLHRKRINIPILKAQSRPMAMIKYLVEICVASFVLLFAILTRSNLCFLSVSPSTLVFLGLIVNVVRRPITVVVHNEIETLVREGEASWISREDILRGAFNLLQRSPARLICLSQAGTRLLQAKYPRLNVQYAPHPAVPLSFFAREYGGKIQVGVARKFGIVGTLREPQINCNIRSLYLALERQLCGTGHSIDIDIIGGVGLESETRTVIKAVKCVRTSFAGFPAPKEYFARLNSCSHVLFLCGPSMYSVSASGVLLDCVSVNVPVFSLPCNFARELSALCPSQIRVFATLEELCAHIVSVPDSTSLEIKHDELSPAYHSNIGNVILNNR